MRAADYLNEAQNALDWAEKDRGRQTLDLNVLNSYLLLAQTKAQLATALAIIEQTEAMREHYQLAHEGIKQQQAYMTRLTNNEAIPPETKAYWTEQQRLAEDFLADKASDEYENTFRDGRRVYRVGNFVHDPERNLVGKIMAVRHDSPGSELEVHFGDEETVRISVWAVDPINDWATDALADTPTS